MANDIRMFEFNEEEDLKKHPVWFFDGTHAVPPYTPMTGYFWASFLGHGFQWGAEKLSVPTMKGWATRIHNGGLYMAPIVVTDPEEIKLREVKFREQLIPFLEDYNGTWHQYIDEMVGHYERMMKVDVDNVSNIELLEHFEDAIRVFKRMWEIHMYMMYLVDGVFLLFESVCKDLLGIDDTHSDFHKLMSGFDNKVFQFDKQIWEFAQRAKELGLAEIILNSKPGEYVYNIEQHPNGKPLLDDLKSVLWEDGWRANRFSELTSPLWVEDPNLALQNVMQFLKREGDFNLDQARLKLAAEREDIEQKILDRIPEEQRDWFEAIMKLAQQSSSFSEEHGHYLDLWSFAMLRRACLAWGKRLAKAGTIDNPEDVFFLLPDEVKMVSLNPEWHDFRNTVNSRRAEWLKWQENPNPPMLSRISPEEAMEYVVKTADPIALKVVVGSFPVVRPELKADLYGVSGSPGIAEGRARVVLSDDDLANIQQGEILVAPATYVSWTAVFSLLAGVVVDRGASLSHAAIVGREYGIPVVMNVMTGSQQIKTGQRIRIDGDMGLVYFLDK